jgi:hypothetical protein
MYVYGLQCSPQDLFGLPTEATADYYIDYGILIFPQYTRPTCVKSHGRLTPAFWELVGKTIRNQGRAYIMDELEHPYITEEEDDVAWAVRELYPGRQTEWFYVPRVASVNQASDLLSGLDSESEADE